MSKDKPNMLKEQKIMKREKHLILTGKHLQSGLKKEGIIEREKHQRLMSKDELNL